MSEEEEITAKKESTMERVDNKLSHYCPHYERDSCLILFKCCNEWYPCHKCHNEAMTSLVEQNEMEPENIGPSPDNETVSGVEMADAEVDSFGEAIEVRSGAEEDPQDDLQIIGEVEDTNDVVSGPSDERSNGESEEDNQENGVEAGSEENDPQVPINVLPLSAEGTGKTHSMATSLDGTLLKCAQCKEEQEFSKECKKCHRSFAKYSCEICRLLIENDVDPYHCPDCGICRANEKDHFHCEVCKVCMSRSIKDSHICSDNRGHDPCAICLEEVFTGASTFSCLHIVHKECAIKLIRSGSLVCPMCRTAIFQNGQNKMIAEIPSNRSLLQKARTIFCGPIRTMLLNISAALLPDSRNINAPSIV